MLYNITQLLAHQIRINIFMADTFTKAKRSEVMSRIRSGNTKPELIVRSFLHQQGFRFSLQSKKLPGKW